MRLVLDGVRTWAISFLSPWATIGPRHCLGDEVGTGGLYREQTEIESGWTISQSSMNTRIPRAGRGSVILVEIQAHGRLSQVTVCSSTYRLEFPRWFRIALGTQRKSRLYPLRVHTPLQTEFGQ